MHTKVHPWANLFFQRLQIFSSHPLQFLPNFSALEGERDSEQPDRDETEET